MDADELACFVPDAEFSDEYTELLLDSDVRTAVNGSRLDAGQTYTFTLFYQKGMRQSQASTKVHP